MEQTKSAVAPQGVFAEISARLAAITPEQFFMPPRKLREGMQVVGTASDDLKSLLTLMHVLDKERDDAIAALNVATDQNEVERLGVVVRRSNVLYQVVREAFWSDVRQQHPELAAKSVLSIGEGWLLAYEPDPKVMSGVQIIAIGAGDLGALFEGLRH